MATATTQPRIPVARRTSVHLTSQNGPMYTVLVVEDERDIREVLRRYLEREGISVLTAGTGAEALHLIESIRPDLVLLDLGLPDIDGVEVLDAAAPAIPVVVLTARDEVSDRINGLRHGADDYVVKPFSPTEVVLRVQAVLGRGVRTALPADGPRSFGGGLLEVDESRHEARLEGRGLPRLPVNGACWSRWRPRPTGSSPTGARRASQRVHVRGVRAGHRLAREEHPPQGRRTRS